MFRQWFGANVDIEPYVGGRFAMGGFELDPGGAKFVEFEPGRKAALRFADGGFVGKLPLLGPHHPRHRGARRAQTQRALLTKNSFT